MASLDFKASAGLYLGKKVMGSSGPRYKRFDTAAEAVRFAIEDMSDAHLRGSILEVDDARYDGRQIRMLYDAPGFPLTRRSS